MFGSNPIYGPKEFDTVTNRLLVTSVFLTLQGEGPYSGRPAVFVRLAYCNLACSFCDTYFDTGDWFALGELSDHIDRKIWAHFHWGVPPWAVLTSNHKRDMVLVITGGEPSLQKALSPFCKMMLDQFRWVQIETNGIITQDLHHGVTVVVSPKCAERDHRPTRYLKPTEAMLARANCLKFVVDHDVDSPYHHVPDWAREWRDMTGKAIYVSPMNRYARLPEQVNANDNLEARNRKEVISFWEPELLDMHENRLNHEYAARYCIQHGLYLSLQTHLLASLA